MTEDPGGVLPNDTDCSTLAYVPSSSVDIGATMAYGTCPSALGGDALSGTCPSAQVGGALSSSPDGPRSSSKGEPLAQQNGIHDSGASSFPSIRREEHEVLPTVWKRTQVSKFSHLDVRRNEAAPVVTPTWALRRPGRGGTDIRESPDVRASPVGVKSRRPSSCAGREASLSGEHDRAAGRRRSLGDPVQASEAEWLMPAKRRRVETPPADAASRSTAVEATASGCQKVACRSGEGRLARKSTLLRVPSAPCVGRTEVCRQLTLLEAWSAGCAPRFPRPHGEMGVGTVIAVD